MQGTWLRGEWAATTLHRRQRSRGLGQISIDGPEQRFLLEKGMVNLPPASLDHSGGGSDRGRSALADALEHISVLQQWRGAKHL